MLKDPGEAAPVTVAASPVLVDLFCGRGGWTRPAIRRGWTCHGFDVANKGYPGILHRTACPIALQVIADLQPSLIVASPPCEDFARHHLPWLRTVAEPSTALLEWSLSLVAAFECPVIIECSRFAARHVPGARFAGSYALWGDVPALLPQVPRRKMSHSGTDPAARAMIEPELATWILDLHTPRLSARQS